MEPGGDLARGQSVTARGRYQRQDGTLMDGLNKRNPLFIGLIRNGTSLDRHAVRS